MTHVFLSLGSNLGNREEHLSRAMDFIRTHLAHAVASSVYETAAVEMTDQGPFLNMVVSGETEVPPRELLSLLLSWEKSQGRERTVPKGPRVIDLDILFYGTLVLHVPGLILPHPAWDRRRFVVEPLFEIAPDFTAPGGGKVAEVRKGLAASGQEIQKIGPLKGS